MATFLTLAAAKTGYLDNSDYSEFTDAAKAKDFINACRALMLLMPEKSAEFQRSAEFNLDNLKNELEKAEAFIVAICPANAISYGDTRDFRE